MTDTPHLTAPSPIHRDDWPLLPYEEWRPTKQTLHRFCQIVGKVRMALTPRRNHWWHVTLYVGARGLTTGPMPCGSRDLEIALDLLDHEVRVVSSDGRLSEFALEPGLTVAAFHANLRAALDDVGAAVEIRARPYGLDDDVPFAEDVDHRSYDAAAVERYWQILAATQRVLLAFGAAFDAKASPVHLFWHSLDLAHARYSGRPAPRRPGVDAVTAEAYSREVIAFGFWPGDDSASPFPAFYSYTAPEPPDLRRTELEPAAARWHDAGGGSLAVLPYEDVRLAPDPGAALLAFYESAFRAGTAGRAWTT